MSDCDKTVNVSYPNTEPCEQVSASCVLTEEAISYLSVEQGDSITEVMAKMVQSLMDSRARLKNAEDRLAAEESLSNAISFVTPTLTTVSGTTEQTIMPVILGNKTFNSNLRVDGAGYEVEIEGRITNSTTANSHVINIKIGTTTLLSFVSEVGFQHTDTPFKIKTTILFKTNGIFSYGIMDVNDIYYYDTSNLTVDNTLTENLDVTFTGLAVSDTITTSVKLKPIK